MRSMSKSVHVLSSIKYFDSRIAAVFLKYLLISAESVSRFSDTPHLFRNDIRSLFFRDSRIVLIMKYPKGKAKIEIMKYVRPTYRPRIDEAARIAMIDITRRGMFLKEDPLSFILVKILYQKIRETEWII